MPYEDWIIDPLAQGFEYSDDALTGGAFDQWGGIGTPTVSGVGGSSYIPADLMSYVKATGDTGTLLSYLAKAGLPLALAAGLFEKNESPLTGALTTTANNAVASAGAFAGMPSVGMLPSSQKAIDLAGSTAGAWEPYVDKAAAYVDKAAGGIPSVDLSTYMNPYIDNELTAKIRDINLSSDQQRMQLRHQARMTGNDTYATPGSTSPTRYGVEESKLNDRRFKAIGDTTANAYKGAFDTATGLASTDLDRTGQAGGSFIKGQGGGAFNTMANTVGNLGGADFKLLGGAGELEAKPQENALTKAADNTKLYSSIIPGTTSATTATKPPSVLGQAAGAIGAYNSATKPGGFLENYKL